MLRTDYFGHDHVYRKRRETGQPGWATDEQAAEYHEILERTLRPSYTPATGRVLELGCGDGVNAIWLARRGYDVCGVDISPAATEWARSKAMASGVQAEFRVGNVLNLEDYPGDAFDIVLDGHCYHCIIGEDRGAFLTSALRVLKPGGLFHVCTMCGDVVGESFLDSFDEESRCLFMGDVATRYIGQSDSLLDEIVAAGFEIAHWEIEARKSADDQDDLIVAATKTVPSLPDVRCGAQSPRTTDTPWKECDETPG